MICTFVLLLLSASSARHAATHRFLDGEDSDVLCAVVASTALGPRARLTAALAFEVFEAPIGAGGRRRLRCGYLGAVVASAALGLRARQRAPLALEELDAPICARWRRWHRRHRRRHRRRHQWRRLWRRHKALRTTRAVLEAASMQPRLRCKPRCRFVCMAPIPTARCRWRWRRYGRCRYRRRNQRRRQGRGRQRR